jgi:uncharacterized protein
MSSLRINVSGLSEGLHAYSLSSPAGELGLDERFDCPVKVTVELEKTHGELFVRARVITEGMFACDRCLDVFRRPVEATYEVVYLLAGQEPAEKSEDHLEVQVLSPDTNIIDFGDDSRQFLLLKLPIRMLCKDDCAGLCPSCGTNLNRCVCDCSVEETDPRWDALRNLDKN